ncbi:MAG: hypothetical protein CVU39_18445, partial [Chloroflexi bacterium HGW-Chloroflexi-10]
MKIINRVPFTILVFFGILLFPSYNEIGLNRIENMTLGQKTQIEMTFPKNTATNNHWHETFAAITAKLKTINFNSLQPFQIFLPTIIKSPESASGVDYFVAQTGNDSNPGTFSKPWRTIQKAANTLVAGDTVKILPGTYYEKL